MYLADAFEVATINRTAARLGAFRAQGATWLLQLTREREGVSEPQTY